MSKITPDNILSGVPVDQAANTVYAGPASGVAKPTFRAIAGADLPLSGATPAAVGTAAAGTGTTVSRADHVHAHGTQAGGALHSEATTSTAGFLSAADKTLLALLAAPPGFSVHKNGTDQTGIAPVVYTKLTWGTEAYDTHGLFASDRFTVTAETAGLYHFIVNPVWHSNEMTIDTLLLTVLYKNGSLYRLSRGFSVVAPSPTAYWGVLLTIHDLAAAGDYYEVYVRHSDTADRTINGSAANTYWSGQWLGKV